ncbi:glycerol-3-phosphate dehydrogenase/oxidase [Nitriliruptoraceae bacterium ZYF776]|nr:glycerol-3-phosphate dehydrogenase/oxidase [Profundirhabdus halotolerans]
MPAPTVSPAPLRREAALDRLPVEVDVLVIGGGITGVGVALDAATRGASVLLVDRGDLAQGTSSRSSKLVHGGARYLASGDLAMVAEGVRERDRLRRMAPHLVLPLPFVLPARSRADLAQLRVGMGLYDVLAAGRGVATHDVRSPAELRSDAPGLRVGTEHGGVRYWDARTDDSRLTLEVARAAVLRGAVVAPHVEVVELRRRGDRIAGARLRDVIGGGEHEVAARWTVSASGVWAGAVRDLDRSAHDLEVVPARGVHLTFPRHELPVRTAVVVPSAADDGRRLFVVPWGEQVYVGTTDDLHEGGLDEASLTAADADYLLAAVRAAFGTDLQLTDAVGAWAGLRPLLRGARAGAPTADLSRRHATVAGPPGLLTITGGKLTTFRAMAADVVDRMARADGWRARSTTTRLRLGSSGSVAAGREKLAAAARRLGIDPQLAPGLHHRHGDRALDVLRTCVRDGEADLLVEGLPYLRGEVRWAARQELVGRLDDVLQRRLRVALRHREAGGSAAIAWSADVLGQELGWDGPRRDAEVARYLDAVRAERGALALPTDPLPGTIATA